MGLEKQKCPDCGRFRRLTLEDFETDREHPYAWVCTNPDCFLWGVYEHDPDYDWRYWGIDAQELAQVKEESPDTYAEFVAMRERYEARCRRKYRQRQGTRRKHRGQSNAMVPPSTPLPITPPHGGSISDASQ